MEELCPERERLEANVLSLHHQVAVALRERDAAIAAKEPNLSPHVGVLLKTRIAERNAIEELERHKRSCPCNYY